MRRLLRDQQPEAAWRRLEPERGLRADEPERSWLLATFAPARCRASWARAEAWRLPAGPFADAMRALTAESSEAALAALAPSLRRSPGAWTELAAAAVHARGGDRAPARVHAERAARSPRAFVALEAHLLLGRFARSAGRFADADLEAQAAAALDPEDARPHSLRAETARLRGDDVAAVGAALDALDRAPLSPRAAFEVAQLLRWSGDEEAWRVADARRSGRDARGNPEALSLAGLLAEHVRRDAEAADLLGAAPAAGASPVAPERRMRAVLARRGDAAGVVRLLRAAVPPGTVEAPGNLLGAAWARVEAAAARPPDLETARALAAVGALEEAQAFAERVGGPEAATLARRLAGERALEDDLVRLLEAGYRAEARKAEPPSLGATLAALREAARARLAPEEARAFDDPARGLASVALVGEWLDHKVDTASPVVLHFRAYGKHLVMGRRAGQAPEGILLSLASLERGREIRTRGEVFRQDVAVGYDRVTRSLVDFRGEDLGGACLPDGVWLDADSARRADHAVRAGAVRAGASRDLAAPPEAFVQDTPDGPFETGDDACVARRLEARYAARRPGDPWGAWRTLAAHEMGHVADLRRYLPLGKDLPGVIALFAREGFSPEDLEMELERRAQLACVAESPDPDLALAELLGAIPVRERVPEAHDGGYLRGARDMIRHVFANPAVYPQIDRTKRILPQLDLLTDDQIRRAAAAALREGRPSNPRR